MDNIINKTIVFVKQRVKNSESGHDWWHISRVWKMAKYIAKKENCNLFVVEMAALLHDIADSKFNNGNEELGPQLAQEFLLSLGVSKKELSQITDIIKFISFKGGNFKITQRSIELDIVQDADRIDALGAIGIARTFNYGGYKNRAIYDPEILPNLNMSKEEYKNSTAPTINHFYEKLLLLKNRMNTETGKTIAEERHRFLEVYLKQFYKEWNGDY